ncbi:MAG TPA: DoxX family protein [Gemmatimonadaceae bacterium]|jgi:putative oxidoreductase
MTSDWRLAGRWPNITLTLLRIVAGLMFMQHGAMKLWGLFLPPGMPAMPSIKPFTQLWFASILELGGGFLVAAGVFTRPVAFLLAGEMSVAYFQVHAKQGFFPAQNQGELAVLYCFIFLVFAAIGGGRFSVDHLFARSHVSRSHEEVQELSEVGSG